MARQIDPNTRLAKTYVAKIASARTEADLIWWTEEMRPAIKSFRPYGRNLIREALANAERRIQRAAHWQAKLRHISKVF